MAVSPDVDAEVRRVTLTNSSDRVCKLEVTSYAEIALSPRRADQAHPAFAKLFLETEYHAASGALLCLGGHALTISRRYGLSTR